MGRFIDLTGKTFGRLTVLRQAEDNVLPSGLHEKMWLCQCECGNQVVVRGAFLRTGHTTSCGCHKLDCQFVDLTGQRFGSVIALKLVSTGGPAKWLCRCDCGNEFVTRGSSLTNGHTKSCGCRKKQLRIKDMVGRKFNRLTVVSRGDDEITSAGARYVRWICRCDCGRYALVRGTALRDGHAISCGCARVEHLAERHGPSKPELMVSEWLAEHGLTYSTQRTFPTLIGCGGGLLSYDFDVKTSSGERVLIECQGEQHYAPVSIFGGEKYFVQQQEHDRRKRAYAHKRGIHLIELDCRTTRSTDDIIAELDSSLLGFQDS